MSIDAMKWAKPIKTGRSSSKSVLTWLADMCGADLTAYPSIASLAAVTELNVKTVQSSLKHLVELGLIEDTGDRRGKTGQVILWRLVGVDESFHDAEHTQKRESYNAPKNGRINKSKKPKNGNIPKNGVVKPSNTSENGSVTEGKTPNFGEKDTQKRDTESISNLKDLRSSPLTPQGEPVSLPEMAVLEHLNTMTGNSFRGGKGSLGRIKARLTGGYSTDDLMLVVDYLTAKWLKDPKMCDYLRPSTLFCPNNCEEYFAMAQKWHDAGRPHSLNGKWCYDTQQATEATPHWNSAEAWEDFI